MSNRVTHTPGPWMKTRKACTHSFKIESEQVLIARLVGTWDESEANATLIAAAPDLAEQLHILLCLLDVERFPVAFDKAEAVLKASGYAHAKDS